MIGIFIYIYIYIMVVVSGALLTPGWVAKQRAQKEKQPVLWVETRGQDSTMPGSTTTINIEQLHEPLRMLYIPYFKPYFLQGTHTYNRPYFLRGTHTYNMPTYTTV